MAYDYLGLVNDINHRLNEVPLTSVTFANATGFYLQAKEAVNASMRYINQAEYQWPFNHVRQEDVLSENVSRYAFPLDCKPWYTMSSSVQFERTLLSTVKLPLDQVCFFQHFL